MPDPERLAPRPEPSLSPEAEDVFFSSMRAALASARLRKALLAITAPHDGRVRGSHLRSSRSKSSASATAASLTAAAAAPRQIALA